MAIALLVSTAKRNDANEDTITSDPINTTGATLTLFAAHFTGILSATSASDSKGNTLTPLTTRQGGIGTGVKIYYTINPIVGAGHTFTWAEPDSFASITVLAFSGVRAFVAQNGAADSGASVTAINSGSVDPGEDNGLVVSALSHKALADTPVVSGGTLAVERTVAYVVSEAVGAAIAFEIQTARTVRSAAWSWTVGSNVAAAAIAAFAPLIVEPSGLGWLGGSSIGGAQRRARMVASGASPGRG